MNVSRVKQFYIGFTATFKRISQDDIIFIKSYLNNKEYNLFNKYYDYDKKHSIRVAKSVYKLCDERNIKDNDKDFLIKTALLHDIGKIHKRITIIDRVFLVLLNKLTKNKSQNLSWTKIKVYYNHGEMGYEVLKNYITDEKMLYIIRNHHKDLQSCDCYREELEILQLSDETN